MDLSYTDDYGNTVFVREMDWMDWILVQEESNEFERERELLPLMEVNYE